MFRRLWGYGVLIALSATVLGAGEGKQIGPRPDLRLAAYPRLRAKVSGTLVREDLAKAVAMLAEKSGVKLSVSEAVKAEGLRLTLSIRDMPLVEAMTAIALLYGLQWSIAGEEFILAPYPSSLTPNMRRLMRAGPPASLDKMFADAFRRRAQSFAQSLDTSLTEVQRAQLSQGLSVNALPPEVQRKLTEFMRQRAVSDITLNMRKMCPDSLASALVRKTAGRYQGGQEVYSLSINVGGELIPVPWNPPAPPKR
jgi:hypothetical protein